MKCLSESGILQCLEFLGILQNGEVKGVWGIQMDTRVASFFDMQ